MPNQYVLQDAHAKTIEKGYADKACAIEAFLRKEENEQKRPTPRKLPNRKRNPRVFRNEKRTDRKPPKK